MFTFSGLLIVYRWLLLFFLPLLRLVLFGFFVEIIAAGFLPFVGFLPLQFVD